MRSARNSASKLLKPQLSRIHQKIISSGNSSLVYIDNYTNFVRREDKCRLSSKESQDLGFKHDLSPLREVKEVNLSCGRKYARILPSCFHHSIQGEKKSFCSYSTICTVSTVDDVQSCELHFPGAVSSVSTHTPKFVPEKTLKPIPCYRVLSAEGKFIEGAEADEVDETLAVAMYQHMLTLQSMDAVFYDAQRQGRFSFHMTTNGEEAVNIASAAALDPSDQIFAQYREPGVLMWRGFTLQQFANQCFGNEFDPGKGRQMPVHYGSKDLCFHTISSPLATQIPHAVGAAYGLKHSGEQNCAVAYFGEGAASEGDFHAALNFASVLDAPVLFLCRNNGWAISTPASEQYRGDGIAGRGQAYGIRSIRVDGNDVLAVYTAVREARRMALKESRPVLVEFLTYRVGHHSTSDDSSRYREIKEILHWKTERDPVARFKNWLISKSWWDEVREREFRGEVRRKVISSLTAAESARKPPLSDMFTHVYDESTKNLQEQEIMLRESISKNKGAYPSHVPL